MAIKSLAVKYRPHTFEDMTEQESIKTILKHQLDTDTIKNVYLFCGPAGCGKTTSARIFANEINKGVGNTIEIDAASNNSVDDVREIIKQAKTKSLEGEYKIFLLDEVHSLSSSAWQAMLKLIEEPPAKSIFIFCTTDSQKIPRTILSRVQRYDFNRMTFNGIVNRLKYIIEQENKEIQLENGTYIEYDDNALSYISKLSNGGMREAISLLDKCLSYNTNLTVENVVQSLGVTNYDSMFKLNNLIFDKNLGGIMLCIDDLYNSGVDIKQFAKLYTKFLLDVCKYGYLKDNAWLYVAIPRCNEYENALKSYGSYEYQASLVLLDTMNKFNADAKYDNDAKSLLESSLILLCAK